jgi:hypothetical protein
MNSCLRGNDRNEVIPRSLEIVVRNDRMRLPRVLCTLAMTEKVLMDYLRETEWIPVCTGMTEIR